VEERLRLRPLSLLPPALQATARTWSHAFKTAGPRLPTGFVLVRPLSADPLSLLPPALEVRAAGIAESDVGLVCDVGFTVVVRRFVSHGTEEVVQLKAAKR
jgi:hypothetical protein